ncbi:unnamed protein product [Rotaria sordida]|uniref:Uncharacterized protein n=1 Tax=Rotaria sordida TaxID=392033 RepID=A0A814S592_9BILA|nr:unnamed protein product [Rotaria sordida]CAF3918417.1 unnamed protein product [Rotaria sordida]
MSSIITDVNYSIACKFIMADQYKFYLTQLQRSQISQAIFTYKQLFSMKTCSLLFKCSIMKSFETNLLEVLLPSAKTSVYD